MSELAVRCSVIGALKGLRSSSLKVSLDESKVQIKEMPDSKF